MLRLVPALLLLLGAVLFHRQVIFEPGVVIPWDLRGHHLPLAAAYSDALHEGVWPLWEPFSYCGRPLLANPQTAVFYPGVFLAVLGSREGLLYRLELLEVVHIFLAGLFTYLLARRMGLARGPALIAGFMFELGGFLASQVQHLSSICGAPWFVLAWLSLLLPRHWTVPVLSVALTLHFFLGFTGYTVMVGASTFMLALVLWAFGKADKWLLGEVAMAGALAAGLAAVQLWPTLEPGAAQHRAVPHGLAEGRRGAATGGAEVAGAAVAGEHTARPHDDVPVCEPRRPGAGGGSAGAAPRVHGSARRGRRRVRLADAG